MTQTIRLIRAKLTATTIFSGGAIRDLARRDQLWILPLAAVGIAGGIGFMGFVLYSNLRALFLLGAQVGKPELLFSFSLLASWVLVFLLGIPVVVSIFFFSRDTAMLLALPIRMRSIVAANAFLAYLSSLGLHLLVAIPALMVYAASGAAGPWFVAAAALFVLAGPLVPLGLAMLAAFALTGAVNLSRYRIALEVAGFVLITGALIVLQVALQRSAMSGLSGGVAIPAALAARLLAVPRAFPPLLWVADAFVLPAGPAFAALFVVLSLAFAVCVSALAARFFARLTVERSATRSRRLSAERYRALGAARSPLRALVAREIAILSGNSSFLFEGVMEGLVFPLILGIMSLTLPAEAREPLAGFISSSPWAGLAAFAVLALMTGINTVSSTSISREGRTFALSLVLPVAGRAQVRAKLLFHLAIFGSGYVLDLAILLAVLRLPPLSLVYLVPGGAGFLVLSFCASILLDLRRPFLSWAHPQQAMKQNMNALAAVGVAFLLVAVHAAVAVVLWRLGAPPVPAGVVVAALSLLESAAALPAVYRYADARYGGDLEMAT